MSNRSDDGAAARPLAYSQIRIREPAGERAFGERLTIGGEGSDVVVPGAASIASIVERREAQWVLTPQADGAIRLNGRALEQPRELRSSDVLSIGDAQLDVVDASRTLLRLDVHHLVGNATIAPLVEVALLASDSGDEDLEIRASVPLTVAGPATISDATPAVAGKPARRVPRMTRRNWMLAFVAALVLLPLLFVALSLETVPVDVVPQDARVRTPGTWAAVHAGSALYLLPGKHAVRAEREGYEPAQIEIDVQDGAGARARLRLEKHAGRLNIDTGGISASVSVDGVVVGKAPGEISVPAGSRTVTLRSPRHLDYVSKLEVAGAGERQELKAKLQPSWGTVKIAANPPSVRVSIDGLDSGVVPAALQVPSGVRRVQLAAPGFKTWQSSVVVRAGETLALGPITLGQPDSRLTMRSQPSGAEVSVGGTYRGHTPLVLELPSGMSHEIVATLPGYAAWNRSVRAEPGKSVALDARLEAVVARVTVQGAPAGADLFIDGTLRGQTPKSLDLTAIEHRIEVRKAGFVTFETAVTPAKGLERTVDYRLTSGDRATALLESAPTIKTKDGSVLKLLPAGTFTMGSERREQGRRPNELQREVTLKRPFYIGVTEVTNEAFRRFRPGHASGYLGKQSLDLDEQAVSQVSWNEAAEYCNWLSERDGLPPAYEKHADKYSLKRPVTVGYRLPTEAEWEYAARRSASGKMLRFSWGDTLPVGADTGNLAGAEAKKIVEGEMPGYSDPYPVVAPVGKFKPNALGLHDFGGNVSEWVNDFYLSFTSTAAATDPLGPDQASRHVVRGANWRSISASELRLAWREPGDDISPTIGFRIARYAE